jgi:glutaredoxin/cytochrome c biogenesis protein CcdA
MLMLLAVALTASAVRAQSSERCIAIELYVRGEQDAEVQTWIEEAIAERSGLKLRVYDVAAEDGKGQERHEKICAYFRDEPANSLPMLYGCSQRIVAPTSRDDAEDQLDELRTMTVYVRSGCPRCARTKDYLKSMLPRYPGFKLVYRDVATDASAQSEFNAVARKYNKSAVSVPGFHFCNQLTVGFDSPQGTGRRLEGLLDRWTQECKRASGTDQSRLDGDRRRSWVNVDVGAGSVMKWLGFGPLPARGRHVVIGSAQMPPLTLAIAGSLQSEHRPRDPPDEESSYATDDADDFELPLPEAPLPADDESDLELPLPDDEGDSPLTTSPAETYPADDEVTLPLFGTVRAGELGLPVFTIVIGLVDGFNPCAMWVLLFLLSILVNLKSRWKILAVAGTFVVISGLVYYAFMAAWLNALALLGQERRIQIVLGTLALLIGVVHVKDFFAFKKGVSFSIPEAAKPGIYSRVRRIVTAENIIGAVIGASTLAVLVNMLELLCTAGLPALYTDVLHKHNLPAWQDYAYLGLYNLAYMFDDGLMVAIATITLGHNKLQEKQGRWLKLLSGSIILALGVVMIFKPDLLQFV